MDIEKLVRTVGAFSFNDPVYMGADSNIRCQFTYEQLQAYTDAVIEECADVGAKAQLNGQYVDSAILALKPIQDIEEEW